MRNALRPRGAGEAALAPDPAYAIEIVERIDARWDAVIGNFADIRLEQTASYMLPRWGAARLRGLLLREATTLEPLAAALQALKQQFAQRHGLLLRVVPPASPDLAPAWADGLTAAGLARARAVADAERYFVDLQLTPDEQLASLGAEWHDRLHEAADVEVREVDPQTTLPTFLELHDAAASCNADTDCPAIGLLPAFIGARQTASQARMFLALAHGTPLAASIVAGCGDYLSIPFNVATAQARALHADHALRWEIMRQLRGTAKWLDLGSDEGDAALRRFKAGNAGRSGRVAAIPGEYEHAPRPLSAAATIAIGWAYHLAQRDAPHPTF